MRHRRGGWKVVWCEEGLSDQIIKKYIKQSGGA